VGGVLELLKMGVIDFVFFYGSKDSCVKKKEKRK
jgi:hypothetical protein